MGPLDKDIVRPDGLRAADGRYELELRSHWYRSLPLSSIAVLEVAIDGEPVPSEDLTVAYEGGRFSLEQLPDQYDEWWFITDPVTVEIPHADATAGGDHQVRVDLRLSIPYIIVGPPHARTPLLASAVTEKTLVAH